VREFAEISAKVAVLVFVVSCMLTAGLGLTVREVAVPLRRGRPVALAIFVNFVVAPAVALALTEVIPIDRAYAIGLILLGGAAGAPFLPKLAELARGDVAFSVGLMLLLMVGSVIFLPIALPLMVRGTSVDTWPILRPLLVTMLLPLAVGMAARWRSERWSMAVRPVLTMISNLSLVLAVVLLVCVNWEALIGTFGSGAAATAILYISILIAVGFALGGPGRETRSVLGLGTGQRNVAAGLIIAGSNFANLGGVVVMVLVATLAGLVPLLIAAVKLRPRPASTKLGMTDVPEPHTAGVASGEIQ
jgi:BASS family bile acid:Na+ symporter